MSTPPTVDLPRGVRRLRLSVTGGTLAGLYAHSALLADRPPRGAALLVHGFTGSKEDFIGVLEPLGRYGWDVLALDLRGHFESDWLPAGAEYSRDGFAADIAEALQHLAESVGGPVHLVGHSLGGLLARAALIRDDSALPRTLTLIGSGPSAIGPPAADLVAAAVGLLPHTPLHQLWALKDRLDAAAGRPQPPAAVAQFLRRRALAVDPESMRAAGQVLLAEPDRVTRLGDVLRAAGSRALVAVGELEDNWTVPEVANMARRLDCDFALLPGVGHSPAAEAPQVTADLLHRFWTGAADGTGPGGRSGSAAAAHSPSQD